MNIYKHIESGKLYTIEQVVIDRKLLDVNSQAGIHATPYKWKGDKITHTIGEYHTGERNWYEPFRFLTENFKLITT